MSNYSDLLNQDFDLRYRPKVGETSYYRLNILYRTLDSRGLLSAVANYCGDFKREVESVDPDWKVYETITWRNVFRREGPNEEGLSASEALPWAENFSYRFSAEDSAEDFPWNFESFPKDLYGWFVLILTIDAHFEFDFLRSSRHGQIEKLRRIGDTVLCLDSNVPFALRFPPVVEVPDFNKQNLRTTFAGLTRKGGEPCALLFFDMDPSPFTMHLGETTMKMSSNFAGTISVRLSDGALQHGDFLEWTWNEDAPGSIVPLYEIRRIEQKNYEAGIPK